MIISTAGKTTRDAGTVQRKAMSEVIWTTDMSFGMPELDASHQDILNGLAQLRDATGADFSAGYAHLLEKIESDFRSEEDLMETLEFPGLKNHREQHARILSILHQAALQVMEGDVLFGQKIIRLLPEWFIQHMATLDIALAEALRDSRQSD